MAGARVKPKCDVVGGKRLPDLKSLQAGKSKRRKLQEGKKQKQKTNKKNTPNNMYSQSKDATSGSSPQQSSSRAGHRWAWEEAQAPGACSIHAQK